jgi:hypothetical protein
LPFDALSLWWQYRTALDLPAREDLLHLKAFQADVAVRSAKVSLCFGTIETSIDKAVQSRGNFPSQQKIRTTDSLL